MLVCEERYKPIYSNSTRWWHSLTNSFNKILNVMEFETKDTSIPEKLVKALEDRQAARKEKNWGEADRLRDLILSSGYLIEDTPKGPKLKKK